MWFCDVDYASDMLERKNTMVAII